MGLPFWCCALVTLISALVSFGFSVAAVRGATARSLALYAAVRSVALVAVAAVPIFTGSTALLLASASAMTIVQAGDAGVGALAHDRLKTFGPAATAGLNLLAVIWFAISVP